MLSYFDTTIVWLETAKLQLPADQCRAVCKDRSGFEAYEHTKKDNLCRLFSGVSTAGSTGGVAAGSRFPIAGYREPDR